MRRIALDSETVALLREHRARVQARLADLGGPFSEQTYVFTSVRAPDHSRPYSPHAVSSRYKDMAERLGSTHTCTPSATTRQPNCSRRVSISVRSRVVSATAVGGDDAARVRGVGRGKPLSCSGLACRSGGRRRSRVDPDARMPLSSRRPARCSTESLKLVGRADSLQMFAIRQMGRLRWVRCPRCGACRAAASRRPLIFPN
jgi:hypothetical protein